MSALGLAEPTSTQQSGSHGLGHEMERQSERMKKKNNSTRGKHGKAGFIKSLDKARGWMDGAESNSRACVFYWGDDEKNPSNPDLLFVAVRHVSANGLSMRI